MPQKRFSTKLNSCGTMARYSHTRSSAERPISNLKLTTCCRRRTGLICQSSASNLYQFPRVEPSGSRSTSVPGPGVTLALDVPKTEATMNVVLPDDPADAYRFFLHQTFHVLGMTHEHQGPLSGGAVTLDEAAVYSCYNRSLGWDVSTVKTQILDVYNSKGVSNFGAVNAASGMIFPVPAALNLQRTDVSLPDRLTDMDVGYLSINYPPPNLSMEFSGYLTLFFDAATAQSVMNLIAQGNIIKLRAIFHAFLLSGRLAAPTPPGEPAHGVNPTSPPANHTGWCGVYDPVDPDDAPVPAMDVIAPSGVLRGAVKNFPISVFGWGLFTRNMLNELWDPYTTIKYGFLSPPDKATDYRKNRVRNALAWYSRNTSLTFELVDGIDTWNFGDPGNPNHELLEECPIRIVFGESKDTEGLTEPGKKIVGWAQIGRNPPVGWEENGTRDREQYLPLWATLYSNNQGLHSDRDLTHSPDGTMRPDGEALLAKSNKTLYHELGHALGFHHEHARDIKANTVDARREQNLVGSAFDINSVMLYAGLKYMKDGKESKDAGTISTDKGKISDDDEETPLRQYPSRTDLAILRLLYPDTEYTFRSGLKQMKFTEKEANKFLGLRDKAIRGAQHEIQRGDLDTLRSELIKMLQENPQLAEGKAPQADPSQLIETREERTARRKRRGLPVGPDEAPYNTANWDPLNPDDQDVDVPVPADPQTDEDEGPADFDPMFDAHTRRPLRTLGNPLSNGPAPPASASGFLQELVTHLKQFFTPGGNQIFSLQFPGRFLDQASYAWDTSSAGIYGQFIKPTAVNEAEFRLVDQLYDVALNVGGPNGTNLSIVYEQLLNNLLPKYVDNGLAQQQDQIRDWLIKDVPTTPWITDIMARQQLREQSLAQAIATSTGTTTSTEGDTNKPPAGMMFGIASKNETLNRIELSELLMNEYLYAKQDWEIERDNLITQATQADVGTPEAQRALNDLTRRLSHITDTRQAQLAAKYADAVVRGYSHTIRQYMGYLDIASPAEALQDAKDSLREAAMSSLDGSMKIYLIQLTPLDWFAGLSTSFTMEDLTQNPEIIRQQIKAKSQDLDTLTAQLVALQMGARGDPTELQSQVQAAQTALEKAQSDLSQQYSNNVIEMAKTYLNSKQQLPSSKDEVAESVAAEIGITPEMLDDLMNGMAAVQKAQDTLTSSSRALSQLLAAQALAVATDTKQQQQQITLQIQSLNADLKELQTRWQVLTASTGGVHPPMGVDHSDQDVPTTPIVLPAESSSGGSRWQEISFISTSESRAQSAKDVSSSEVNQWNCNLWFASASGGSSSSSGESDNNGEATSDTFELAMRVTLVTVDRGGWFQPQFFKESKTFYRVNPDLTWTDATAQTMSKILDGKQSVTGLMPGYPTAFLIAKDIVVRITHDATATGNSKATDMESAATSGGILCFSYSNSSSSNSTATSSSFQSYANGFVVKVPGPQILGYMVQVAEPDQTTLMPATLPANFFIPDDDYNKVVKGEDGPDHGLDPRGPQKTVEPPAPTITQEKLREVLDGMLNDRIGEIFDRVNSAS
ncbi:hypothetical protein C8R45DRAFT_299355 [Mycena sanguinolenta]|nr:hypothetical protein C8R45DRAFT_299355 [Mycena sanguinolenta]